MRKSILLITIFIIVLFSLNGAFAATIHGTIYDLDLDKVTNAVVAIDTIPRQVLVAKEGTYSFNVPIGSYVITANYTNSYTYLAKEELIIRDEGDYVIDLFLFPSFAEEEELIGDTDFEVEDEYFKKSYGLWVLGLIFIIIIVIFIVILYQKRIKVKKEKNKEEIKEKEEIKKELKSEDYYNKTYEIIKKERRTTQKNIRKQIPLSEAKISLIITQLEHEGKIQKIKKGRGNILILK